MKREKGANVFNTLKIQVGSDQRKELFLTVTSLLGLIRGGDGCLKFEFYEDTEQENAFLLVGEWETEEAWDNHLRSDEFAILLGSLKLLAKRSNMEFNLLSPLTVRTRGSEQELTNQRDLLKRQHS